MPTIMTVYGTRPEAIKMAPLIESLRTEQGFTVAVAVTGQHREMLDQVNDLFAITPEHDMDIMSHGASLAEITTRSIDATSRVLRSRRPDAVVVQGDTTSAFGAALASFYEKIPVVHLEAGLRTGDIYSPFPEEVNRRLISPLAALNLAPTPTSRANLQAEGIDPRSVAVTGNTVIDALRRAVQVPAQFSDPRVAAMLRSGARILLVTAHRRESWGAPLAEAMSAVRDLAQRRSDLQVLLPMHRNPVVRDTIEESLTGLSNVLLTEPLGYHEFAQVLNAAHLVLTDSGGVQEEAPSLGKPVLVMRDTTERPEAVAAGTVRLVGTCRRRIMESVLELLDDPAAYRVMAAAVNPYGDGQAASRGSAAIGALLGLGKRLPDFEPRATG